MHLIRYQDVPGVDPSNPQTKAFQRPFLEKVINEMVGPADVTGDIGPRAHFNFLVNSPAHTKVIIEPYTGAGGAGLDTLPQLPYPVILFRCELGKDSDIIPSKFFDVTFSCSVLEHIGQAEAKFDCTPTDDPPCAQEVIRDVFCQELFRVTKPGGITFHTVDHAARNLSFGNNFRKAGFEPITLVDAAETNVEEALNAPDAVRQRVGWRDASKTMSEAEQSLHGVLFMSFRRPDSQKELSP